MKSINDSYLEMKQKDILLTEVGFEYNSRLAFFLARYNEYLGITFNEREGRFYIGCSLLKGDPEVLVKLYAVFAKATRVYDMAMGELKLQVREYLNHRTCNGTLPDRISEIKRKLRSSNSFIPRTTEWYPTDMHSSVFFNDEYYIGANSSLPNCTVYAIGRAAEVRGSRVTWYTSLGQDPPYNPIFGTRSGFADAYLWCSDAYYLGGWAYSRTCRECSIACYGESYYGVPGGHVAFVEGCDDNYMWLSESSYGGVYFQYVKYTKLTGDDPISEYFQGYILHPEYAPPTPEKLYVIASVSPDSSAGAVETNAEWYHTGEEAIITAVPGTLFRFDHWSDGSTNNPIRYIFEDHDIYITAYFVRDKYRVYATVEPEEGGSVTTDFPYYFEGDNARITAIPADGWIFDHWSDGSRDPVLRHVFEAEDFYVTAYFKKAIPPISLDPEGKDMYILN